MAISAPLLQVPAGTRVITHSVPIPHAFTGWRARGAAALFLTAALHRSARNIGYRTDVCLNCTRKSSHELSGAA